MRIGLVRRGYSSTGGAENYLRRLADALETAGHAPVLFATADWPPAAWPAHRDRVVINRSDPRAFADAVDRLSAGQCDRLFSLERLWRCDCYRAGDGVHQSWLERRARLEAPWRRWFRHLNPKHRQILALEHRLFADGGAGKIIANSRMVRDEIVHWYGTPPERIAVIYNGLPPGSFGLPTPERRAQARAALGLGDEDYAVLFAGTGWERKGLSHLLAAAERLPSGLSAQLLVAGRGDPRPYLHGMSRRLRECTRFLGPVSDMSALYAAADVFVAPTLYDPFSNACLEAMASGLPVLTTSANGFAEIIDTGVEGEVFAPTTGSSDEELTSLLERWSNPQKRAGARPICAAKAANLSIEENVTLTLRVLIG